MKLLLFSDLHTDAEKTRSIVDRSGGFDVLVGAGDFCHCRRDLELMVSMLSAIRTPTVLVPGNSESFEELHPACGGRLDYCIDLLNHLILGDAKPSL